MASSQLETKGFFAALFDFQFTSFITLKFLRVIYAVLVAVILLLGLVFFIALATKGAASLIVGLILVPIVTLLYLVFARIWMETIALFFRIGENTSLMAAAMGRQAPPLAGGFGGPATGYGAPGTGYGEPPQPMA